MLVFASMMIWGTPVTGLQFFGYSIALSGMVYFKLGYDNLKKYAMEANRQWAEFGATRPALRKIIIIGSAMLFLFVVLGGLAPTYAPDTTKYLTDAANNAATKVGITSV